MAAPSGGLGRAFVQVRADLSRFNREVRRVVNNTIADVEDWFTRGRFPNAVRNAAAQAGRDFARVFNFFASRINIDPKPLLRFAGTFVKVFAGVGALVNTVSTLVPLVAALGAGLAKIGAAAASALPFLISGFIAVSQTIKLAVKGVGEAFKAIAEDDVEKLNEALKKLSPAAQAFVKEVAKARPQFKALQQAVQESFFKPLQGAFTAFSGSGVFGILKTQLSAIAATAGGVAAEILKIFTASAKSGQLTSILRSVNAAFSELTTILPNLLRSFLLLAEKAGPEVRVFFEDMATAVSALTGRIQGFATSGGVHSAFLGAKQFVGGVVDVMRDLGAIIGAVFTALTGGAGQAQGPLLSILSTIRGFVESKEGAAALAAIGSILATVGRIVSGIIAPLLPVVARLVQALAGPLAETLAKLERPLVRLAEAIGVIISRFIEAAGPVLDELMAVFTDLAVEVLGMLAQHMEEMGPLFTELAKQIGPELVPLVKSLGEVLKELLPVLPELSKVMIEFMKLLVEAGPIIVFLVGAMAGVAKGVAILIGWLAQFVGWLIRVASSGAIAWFKTLASLLTDELPKAIERAKQAFGAVVDFLVARFNESKATVLGALNAIGGFLTELPGRVRGWLAGLGEAISKPFTDGFNTVKNVVNSGISALSGAIGRIPGVLRGFVGSIAGAASSIGRAIGDGIANIPGFAAEVGSKVVAKIKGFANSVVSSINAGISRLDAVVPFSLPRIPYFAHGAIVDRPTLGVFGEAGPEVVIPLNNPARARELADESGLSSLLGNFGGQQAPHVSVFIGDEEITKRVDVRIAKAQRGQARELAYGVRGL